jgi:site-specific recombinase XerD
MQIYVRETKTRMDRYAILSKKTLDLLTQYWFACGRPKDILFPNKFNGRPLTISSVEQVMRRTAASAGISGKVTPHCLRHSFATHLLEDGVDIRYIQALLGHLSPRSTEIYLHVSNKTIMGIKSPFDNDEGKADE